MASPSDQLQTTISSCAMSSNPVAAVIFMGVSVGIAAYTFRPILEQDKRNRIAK